MDEFFDIPQINTAPDRAMSEDEWRELWDAVFDRSPVGRRSKAVPEFFRIGVQFADGRKATHLCTGVAEPFRRLRACGRVREL